MGGWSPSDYSVCPRPLLQFYAHLRRTGRVVGYASIRQFTSVYVGWQGRGARQYEFCSSKITKSDFEKSIAGVGENDDRSKTL